MKEEKNARQQHIFNPSQICVQNANASTNTLLKDIDVQTAGEKNGEKKVEES